MTPTPTGSPTPGDVITPDQPTLSDPTPRTCELCAPTPPHLDPDPAGRVKLLLCSLHTAELALAGMTAAQRADYHVQQQRDYYPLGLTRPVDTPLMRLLPTPLYDLTCPAALFYALLEHATPAVA